CVPLWSVPPSPSQPIDGRPEREGIGPDPALARKMLPVGPAAALHRGACGQAGCRARAPLPGACTAGASREPRRNDTVTARIVPDGSMTRPSSPGFTPARETGEVVPDPGPGEEASSQGASPGGAGRICAYLSIWVVFQKWRWTEIAVTLDLIFVVSLRKEWS